ncbi:plastocyanin/azurin family copper-binding protein [Halomarina litorea]|uniref:plastocyanin/azurin family copper-binding protein n=1 Tax=Halomarina litorea TaxID=2961595 RepID=UPI0020C3A830|nr:plastocyanin/azurin family copper-binding protein [Halomarina sp. BCD28]
MDRRTLLARAAALGAVALAGCTGDEPTNGTTDGASGTTAATGTTSTAATTGAPTTTEPTDDPTTGSATRTDDGAGATTTEADAPTDTPAETPTETPTPTPDDSLQDAVTVTVGANGRARFSPESFTLARGGTVTWEWEGGGHNVVPERQPSGANWEGTAGGESRTHSSGHTYEATFDTAGEYEYYCSPHRSIGMTGSFTVE